MSLLSRLFGRGSDEAPATEAEAEHYNGYAIYPAPIRDGTQWRIAARIEKEVGGELRVHQLVRADTMGDAEMAATESANKARRLIDEQGETIFDRGA
jgi:hypothetical protein